MAIPKDVERLDEESKSTVEKAFSAEVAKLSIADIEEMSIRDISAIKNPVLRDLLNDAIRSRLALHVGGSYTSAPAGEIGNVRAI